MTGKYEDYINSKRLSVTPSGVDVPLSELNDNLFDFQKASVSRALKLGRSALFANTGLGKGFQILSWCEQTNKATGKPVLMLAPLAVSHQFVRESQKIGIEINIAESDADIINGINISNYEKLHKFSASNFSGIALDESSILKNSSGKYCQALIDFSSTIPYRLSATATPSPNDFEEFGTQCEFLGVMTKSEMLATFFTHDGGDTSTWRLKKWGENKFWEWLSSWATIYRMPSDIGFSDEGFVLPELIDHHHSIKSDLEPDEGMLFAQVGSMTERRKARKSSITDRIQHAADLINNSDEHWLVWCELNDEADLIESLVKDSKQVKGSQKPELKEKILDQFSDGDLRVLVSKPSICGAGMNWQHCRNVLFVGINDSWESLYQATNRVYRFGQTRSVNRHLVFTEHEYPVFQNLKRKAEQAEQMWANSSRFFRDAFGPTDRYFVDYKPQYSMEIPSWL